MTTADVVAYDVHAAHAARRRTRMANLEHLLYGSRRRPYVRRFCDVVTAELRRQRRRLPHITITLPTEPVIALGPWPCPWIKDDGGRAAAGYVGTTGDCMVRSLAIALQLPYRTVVDEVHGMARAEFTAETGEPWPDDVLLPNVLDNGFPMDVFRRYLAGKGWQWTACTRIGTGTRVHLRSSELPAGRLIARCSLHTVAVVDGVVRDTYDPTRGGKRAVYGYWAPPAGGQP